MGDMADMALDQAMTMEELRMDYRSGLMGQQEALDAGIIDQLGYEYSARKSKTKTCSMCGKEGLVWMKHEGHWVLGDELEMHDCPNKKWVKK